MKKFIIIPMMLTLAMLTSCATGTTEVTDNSGISSQYQTNDFREPPAGPSALPEGADEINTF